MENRKYCHSNYGGRGLVMVEDEKIRNNRLALLDGIGQLFLRIADFSKLT
jgi:glycyl-tRNA synthetase beta subunit